MLLLNGEGAELIDGRLTPNTLLTPLKEPSFIIFASNNNALDDR